MDVLVTYDVETLTPEGQKRLAQVAKVCESYGIRAQNSVFECRLSDTMLAALIAKVQDIIDPRADSVNVYRLAGPVAKCRSELGRRPVRELGEPWIL